MGTYYETLGVEQAADANSLRQAYRKLARSFHPDVNPEPGSTDRMARINEAFWTLIDPTKRSEYDSMLRAGLGDGVAKSNGHRERSPVSVRLHLRLRVHKTPIYGLAFTPDSGELVSCSFDNELIWWNPESGAETARARIDTGAVSALRAIPEGRVVAAGSAENMIGACVFEHGRSLGWRQTAVDWASCLSISPDGKRLAAGTIYRTVLATDIVSGKVLFSHKDHAGSVTAIAWSDDGKYLVSGSGDASVRLRDAETGKVLHTFTSVPSTVTSVAFSSDNRFLAAAGSDLTIRVLSLADGSVKKVLFGHSKPIESLAFHPNGWLFASCSRDGALGLWNAAEGLGQVYLEASSRPILTAAFNANGTKVASAGLDKTVRVWNIRVKAREAAPAA